MERLAKVRVLDPACGSGNFLYVSLNELKNLEKEVWTYAGGIGLTQPELGVSPAQLHGIEKNQFAAELAQVVVWIGYLQWKRTNGFFDVEEPILQNLHNIECRDAVLTVDLHGNPTEPDWPEADVIVGNPPFLGGKKMRGEMGDAYVDELRKLYEGRIPPFADLVCYWFERARAYIVEGKIKRAGLLATNSIRGGANRTVLERIKEVGDIFMAWSDRPWVLDGAAVRVSIVGFDNGAETQRALDGLSVSSINPDLTGSFNLTVAGPLKENAGIAFIGNVKTGPFDIDDATARTMLEANGNPNGRPNSDVVRPYINGLDVTRRPRKVWAVDFGIETPEEEAKQYELPYAYVLQKVKPFRATSKSVDRPDLPWWLHRRTRPAMRAAVSRLQRFIATPTVAKHRLFAWFQHPTLADHQIVVIARDDDYFFGVLHSKFHELWTLRMCTWLGVGNDPRYTPTTTFETYPFPWAPGKEDQSDPKVQAIAEAARELVRLRDEWLNPSSEELINGGGKIKDRTLTNLYNKRPDWLDLAHKRLNTAVFDAYGWPQDLSDDEILARLLALNLERAAAQGEMAVATAEEETADVEGEGE